MAVRSQGIGDPEGPIAEQEDLVHRRLEAAEEAVERWGSRGGSDAGGGGVSDFPELAAAVRELISLSSGGGSGGQRAKMALQVAMTHLEDEFRQVLISGTYFLPPDSHEASLHDNIAVPARSLSFSSFPNLEALSISSFSFTASTDDSRTYCSGFTRDSVSMEKIHLRNQMRIIILNQVVPAYCSYIGRYGSQICKYIKYIPNDIENIVLDLFEG
ncbi:exocyst complex component EXO70A1-like [Panicum miliaceum]|uniref:Exocyst subunit Exo70 family protein n=1 Tax=Panicum miliaceum TaxID=4540 RepID=A0A3L6S0Q7_PANMI|nr:exocyst complex component EXO70A1-like [Panicum miliaceum]